MKKFAISMGMKTINPMERVGFYKTSDPETVIVKKAHEISTMMPEKCQSTVIRLFVKDDAKMDAAKRAFDDFCAGKLGDKPDQLREHAHSQTNKQIGT